jgi:integrase/recombinase XerD
LYNGGLRVSELVTLRWRNLVDGVVKITGKGGKTRVVRFSRGTWDELAALRAAEPICEDFVFPMSAVNAWKRVKARRPPRGDHGRPGLAATSCSIRTARTPCAAAPTSPLCAIPLVMHASIATTSRYLHARPEKSSGDYLAV